MRALDFIIRRLFTAAFVLLGASIITFFLARVIPGDAAALYIGPKAQAAEKSLRRFYFVCFTIFYLLEGQLNLLARAYHCILKLARTIAGLAGSGEIQPAHLTEAVQYRPKWMTG